VLNPPSHILPWAHPIINAPRIRDRRAARTSSDVSSASTSLTTLPLKSIGGAIVTMSPALPAASDMFGTTMSPALPAACDMFGTTMLTIPPVAGFFGIFCQEGDENIPSRGKSMPGARGGLVLAPDN
jgi:hypothetical protein